MACAVENISKVHTCIKKHAVPHGIHPTSALDSNALFLTCNVKYSRTGRSTMLGRTVSPVAVRLACRLTGFIAPGHHGYYNS